ncbi:MAG: LapA family protein [Parvularculaceae bacterium]
MKWIYRLFWIPILTGAVLFLVANREPVAISLDPFRPGSPALSTPPAPLWFWLMVMLFFGVALGAVGGWLSGRPARIRAREDRRSLKAVTKEVAALKARLETGEPQTLPIAQQAD